MGMVLAASLTAFLDVNCPTARHNKQLVAEIKGSVIFLCQIEADFLTVTLLSPSLIDPLHFFTSQYKYRTPPNQHYYALRHDIDPHLEEPHAATVEEPRPPSRSHEHNAPQVHRMPRLFHNRYS